MSSVFYRVPGRNYPKAVDAQGVYIQDAEGRRYLDASGGAAISCLGHAHPVVKEAIHRQVEDMAFAHTMFFTNQPQEELAVALAEQFPEPGAHVYFLSGGSEANETAIKLARHYWVACERDSKHIVISRRQSYHGNTLGALSISGNTKRREPYEPLLHDWPRISPCFAYRHQRPDEDATEYALRCADELEEAILAAGPENVAAFIAETVVGASLGAVTAEPGYFARIREICDRHDVLLILDEVMAGCGRTGTWFAFDQEGVVPDIVTLAKGLGGGYLPIAAVVARAGIYQRMRDCGGFTHGHTYVGHATACAASLAVIGVIQEENLLLQVKERGRQLDALLKKTFLDHPAVGDIRGRGLLRGIELVGNRDGRQLLSAGLGLPAAIRQAAMQAGLICYPGGGTADGEDGMHILLAPPFTISAEELGELVARLQTALESVTMNHD